MKKIAITLGDENGIGTEILHKLICENFLNLKDVKFKIFCFEAWLKKLKKISENIEFEVLDEADFSFRALELASKECLEKKCHGLVTGPISKQKWLSTGHNFTGQTEFLGELTKTSPEMLFMTYSENLKKSWKVLLLTRHIPLKDVSENLTYERLKSASNTLRKFLSGISISEASIGMAALNPHAGEGGEIGTEELKINAWCRDLGIDGCFSPDQIWFESASNYSDGLEQKYDAYLAPYHDQVLPLIKTITRLKAVNVSIGLPFIRTSPDHGTAFDLVGTGKADHQPFLEAIKLCVSLSI